MRVCQRSATFQKFISGLFGRGVEKPKPGSEGTMTSNASAGSPPNAPGFASGPMPEGPRPTMSQEKWNGVRADTRSAHKMHRNAIDVHLVMFVAIDGCLRF